MSAVEDCVSQIERLLGSLSHQEKQLTKLLCSSGIELNDIVAAIKLLRWLPIKRQIENQLGRTLSPEEARIARRMHRKGATVDDICKTLDPGYKPSGSSTPKPKV